MRFTCEIKMDNAAFHEVPDELARILHVLAGRVRDDSGVIMDVNGNRVGTWELINDDLVRGTTNIGE